MQPPSLAAPLFVPGQVKQASRDACGSGSVHAANVRANKTSTENTGAGGSVADDGRLACSG